MNEYGAVPLWPCPSYGQRSIWGNTRMTDIRRAPVVLLGGELRREAVAERKLDGVFLDVLGARPWGSIELTNWSQAEKNAWTDGAIDLVRRLDAKRPGITN